MKKALILHGWWGNSKENWFPWIEKQLEKKGYEVIIPDLPNSNYPVIEEHLEVIKNTGLTGGDLLIGHSGWCKLWLQHIEQNDLQWLSVIFVAPTYNDIADELWETILWDAFVSLSNYNNTILNFFKLNRALNAYVVMLSDDDPYINSFSAKQYYGQLDNLSFVDLSWRGHFNTDAWVTELPEIKEYM